MELTADKLLGHFKIEVWSPKGSNDREDEEAIIVNWENYVRETAGQSSTVVPIFVLCDILHIYPC